MLWLALQEEGQQGLSWNPMEEVLVRAEAERSVLVYQSDGEWFALGVNSFCHVPWIGEAYLCQSFS